VRAGAAVGALVGLLGCSQAEAPATQGAAPKPAVAPLAPEAIEPYKTRLDAALAENAARACPRPVLRGEARPGNADPAIRALMEPSGPLQACYEAVAGKQDLGRPCASLPDAVQRAVAHEDACSPYLLGRNPAPPSLTPYMRIGTALASLGDARIAAGQARQGWALWLDGIRLGQDLARGGTTWLEAMVAHAGAMSLIEHAHEVVARDGLRGLSAADVDAVRGELRALVGSEPHPRTHMLADPLYPLLYEVVPPLMPPGWTPPGGWPPDQTHPGPAEPREQRQLLVTWQVLERIAAKQAEACPANSDVAQCLEGLDTLVSRMTEAGKPGLADVLELALDPEQASFEMIAATLEGMVAPSWSKYLKRQALRRVALHALAVRVAVRSGEPCPDAGAADLVVPGLGDALRVEADSGTLVAPPLVTRDEPVTWTLSCGP